MTKQKKLYYYKIKGNKRKKIEFKYRGMESDKMKKIILIEGASKEKGPITTAKNKYSESRMFREIYQYAKRIGDEVYIINATYGLLEEDAIVGEDKVTIESLTSIQKMIFAKKVAQKLGERTDLSQSMIEIIAEKQYYQYLMQYLPYCKIHFEDIPKSHWLLCIQKNLREEKDKFIDLSRQRWRADLLHQISEYFPVYDYRSIDKIPFENGVYIMMDQTELLYGKPRIVRVGTHRKDDRLKGRLRQHLLTEDKNASNLRRYVGEAILYNAHDSYNKIWQMNLRDPEVYKLYSSKINTHKEHKIEVQVSNYLRERMIFCCINIESEEARIAYKEKFITYLCQDKSFKPSEEWLGKQSPKLHITAYGLWNGKI